MANVSFGRADRCKKNTWTISMKRLVFSLFAPVALATSDCGTYRGEFHLVYDISGSFEDDLVNLRALAPTLFADLEKEFPGSRFSIGTFSDKNYPGVGRSVDICYQTNIGLTTNTNSCVNAINSIKLLRGDDEPESQLDALFHGLMDPAVGWSNKEHDQSSDPVARVIILATDASYHKPGDTSLKKHDGSAAPKCTHLDYASVDQIRSALIIKGVTPLFLTDKLKLYNSLLAELGLGGAVEPLATDSSNVISAIKNGLNKIVCETLTTTTSGGMTTEGSHTTAEGSHTTAGDSHTTAGDSHTTAGDSHTTAGGSHTTAGDSHTTPEGSHSTSPPMKDEEEGGGGAGVVVGAAGGVAALAAAAGGGLYAYQQSAAAQSAAQNYEAEGELAQAEREMAAEIDMGAFA